MSTFTGDVNETVGGAVHTWCCICAGRPPAWWPAPLSWCSSATPASASSRTGRPSPCAPAWSGTAALTGATAGPPGTRRSPAGCGGLPSPPSAAHWTVRCRWCGWSLCGWRRTVHLQGGGGGRERKLYLMIHSAIWCLDGLPVSWSFHAGISVGIFKGY